MDIITLPFFFGNNLNMNNANSAWQGSMILLGYYFEMILYSLTVWSVLHEANMSFKRCTASVEPALSPDWHCSWTVEPAPWGGSLSILVQGLHWSLLTVDVWAREEGRVRRGHQKVPGEPGLSANVAAQQQQLYSIIAPLSNPTANRYLHTWR